MHLLARLTLVNAQEHLCAPFIFIPYNATKTKVKIYTKKYCSQCSYGSSKMHTININQYTNPSLQTRRQENTVLQLFCQNSDMYVSISGQQQNVSYTVSLVYMEIYLWQIWFIALNKFLG
jgi:hypothetical protein